MVKVFIPTSRFKKQLKKTPPHIIKRFKEVITIFEADEFDKCLNNHKLQGEYSNYRSVNISADWRLVYEKIDENSYRLILIGTHSELYR